MAEDLVKRLHGRLLRLGASPGSMLDFMNGIAPLLKESADLIEQQSASLAAKDKEIERLQHTSVGDWASQRENDSLTIELYELKARAEQAERALNREQDNTYASFDKWSKALGWGLTGNQPECWALMDSAVEELVSKRRALAEAVKVMEGIANHPDKYDDGKRSYAIGWAFWNIQGMAHAFVAQHGSGTDQKENRNG